MNAYKLFAVGVSIAVASASAHASELNAPKEITFAGARYQLAFSHSSAKESLWEYTTDGESFKDGKWTRLVTIKQLKVSNMPMSKWVDAIEQMLDQTTPRPLSSVEQTANEAYSRILYLPSGRFPTFESNVWHTRHIGTCGGIVNLQFARQYKAGPTTATSDAELLKTIERDTETDMAALRAVDWQPTCS
ncbi:hypothetical protein D9M69_440120 [compost metagenome]